MSLRIVVPFRFFLLLAACAALCGWIPSVLGQAPAPGKIPSAEEVVNLLQREPITLASWPVWRVRLLDWINDRGHSTDEAYKAVWAFTMAQANAAGELPPALAGDALAWYFLGSGYLMSANTEGAATTAAEDRAEKALRKSLLLDSKFARTPARLAIVLIQKELVPKGPAAPVPLAMAGRLGEARKELDEARRLEPTLPWLKGIEGQLAFAQKNFVQAEHFFMQSLEENPAEVQAAHLAGMSILNNPNPQGKLALRIKPLVDRFPSDAPLACQHALALAIDQEWRAAERELERARGLGIDPATIFPREVIQRIEQEAAPGLLERGAWILAYFAGFYALVMAFMAVAGLVLAGRTRGSQALQLLGEQPDELVTEGQVVRSRHESALAKLYALTLVLGLILFYVSIPFIVAGLLGVTGLLLYGIFQLGRIPIKLVVIVVLIGGGMAWAVLKSLFSQPGRGSFGLPKTAADCPRLYQSLNDVARRVDTNPVDQVYLAPGASIGVHQEGRGPFGIFGVKNRVLTLGLSTMHFLTVSELQAILAHEYAHFSHRDTLYNRFIYQVTLSIQQAIHGMGQAGGAINYLNPFYWFLYLYYHSYTLLSAGFSRSREFLADRMASSLYGSDVFASGLTKVSTDGSLFEMTIYSNISQMLDENKAFINMYAAFRTYRDEQMSGQEREELYQKLLDEKESLFATHPTFRERIEAVMSLPRASKTDTASALSLFDNPEEIEKELSDFLTGFMHHVRMLQAQAAAAGH